MPPDQAAWARWLAGVDGLAAVIRGLDAALRLRGIEGEPVSLLVRQAFAAGYEAGKKE